MTYLNKDQILSSQDFEYQDVNVPEWGGKVRIRGLTAGERDEFETEVSGKKNTYIRANLVGRTAVDENGERLFTNKDIEALAQKSACAVDRLFAVSSKLSALSAKDVDELEGN